MYKQGDFSCTKVAYCAHNEYLCIHQWRPGSVHWLGIPFWNLQTNGNQRGEILKWNRITPYTSLNWDSRHWRIWHHTTSVVCRIVYTLCINRLSCNEIVVGVIAVCTVKVLYGPLAGRPNTEKWRKKTGNTKELILHPTVRCGGMVICGE
jgi:hypothetical protein